MICCWRIAITVSIPSIAAKVAASILLAELSLDLHDLSGDLNGVGCYLLIWCHAWLELAHLLIVECLLLLLNALNVATDDDSLRLEKLVQLLLLNIGQLSNNQVDVVWSLACHVLHGSAEQVKLVGLLQWHLNRVQNNCQIELILIRVIII